MSSILFTHRVSGDKRLHKIIYSLGILTVVDHGFELINIFIIVFVISYCRKIDFKPIGLGYYELALNVLIVSLSLFAFAEFLSFINYLFFNYTYLDFASGCFEVLFGIGLLGSVFLAKTAEDREFDKMKRASVYDGLTDLHNPAYLDVYGLKMFENARFEETPLSVIFLDIDHLKSFNDAFGPEEGNAVLKLLASSLKKLTRSQDAIVRHGGDKFIIVSPTDADTAKRIADRICHFVEQNFIPEKQPALKRAITASLGVSTLSQDINGLRMLIDKAYQALCKAKSSGRNRVVVSDN